MNVGDGFGSGVSGRDGYRLRPQVLETGVSREQVAGIGGEVQNVERCRLITKGDVKVMEQLRNDGGMEGVVKVENTGRSGHDDGSGVLTENAGWREWLRLGLLPISEVLSGDAGESGIEFDTENVPKG